MKNPKTKRLLINIVIVAALAIGTAAAIEYAKGYRPNIQNRIIQGTGLISLTSYPKSARVIINDRLTTVTDDKLYLTPGDYTIKIEKDGFSPWQKTVPVKSELVTSVDARLFPLIPAISPITFYQVDNVAANPDNTKIAYVVSHSPVSADNGLYVYSLTGNLLGSQNIQIASADKDYSSAILVWSPDSSQILVIFTQDTKTGQKIASSELLSTKSFNQTKDITDVTYRLPLIVSEWQDQLVKINQNSLSLYPDFMTRLLSQSAINVYFSPDKEKVVYSPTQDIKLPANDIGTALPNINSTTETRQLTKGDTYVYDLKEGTNYLITESTNLNTVSKTLFTTTSATLSGNLTDIEQIKAQTDSRFTTNTSWYGSSQLMYSNGQGVAIVDYDNVNPVTVTNAQIKQNFVVASPDYSKLIMLTNINQQPDTFNLMSFDLK